MCSTNEDGAGLPRRRFNLPRSRQKLVVFRAETCRATASFAVNDVGGDVFFYMCPPRFVNAGRHVPARVTPRAATQSTIESSRSVFPRLFFSGFYAHYSCVDADERHRPLPSLYRLSGTACGSSGTRDVQGVFVGARGIVLTGARRVGQASARWGWQVTLLASRTRSPCFAR